MVDQASLSLDNPVFRMFLGYATVVILKTMAMTVFTAIQRFRYLAFINTEDVASLNKSSKKPITVQTNEKVERVRRCHLNDLENVIPFVLLGLLYVTTGPTIYAASLHFRLFTGFRFLHTVVYLGAFPQPSRAITFFGGYLVTFSMAYSIIQQAAF